MNRSSKITIFLGILVFDHFLLGMEFMEQYQEEKLRLIPCPQCQRAEPFFEKLKPMSNDLVRFVLQTIHPELKGCLVPPPRENGPGSKITSFDLRRGVEFYIKHKTPIIKSPEGVDTKSEIQAVMQALGYEAILLKAKLFQIPYQAGARCDLDDLLRPYIKQQKKCALIIDKTEELNETSADALRSMMRTRRSNEFLKFIFLTSKNFDIPQPLKEFLNMRNLVEINK